VDKRKRNVAFARQGRLVYGNLNRRAHERKRRPNSNSQCGLLAPLSWHKNSSNILTSATLF